ncbi:MAG TPA: hypothetical protein VF813_05290, partial [Anaerolineaceae bacterium]
QWGMGVRIPLTPLQARAGFDRFLVLGLRLSADETQGKGLVEDLLQHHQYGRDGFSLLPQGTPTNNTEKEGSGFTRADDADASFDLYLKDQGPFPVTADLLLKNDGQRLAEALGIDVGRLGQVLNARGTDGMEASSMNVALWPATLGYWMETMLAPVFSDPAIEFTRSFFTYFVTGRGALPAVRVGNQPYGVLPTAALSKVNWFAGDRIHLKNFANPDYLAGLYRILITAGSDWSGLVQQVSYVGKTGDAHKLLLDIIGLNPDSVEYYQRYAESIQHIFNVYNLTGLGSDFLKAIQALGMELGGMQILNRMGYTGGDIPEELKNFFSSDQHLLKGPVIDDRPLSETFHIRAYTPDNRNYIRWLADAARASLDVLRQEQGFTDNKTPAALLYLFLRHALIQSYWGSSIRLYLDNQVIAPAALAAVRQEPAFIHIAQPQAAQPLQSESRWKYLYQPEPRVTGDPRRLVSDYITAQIGKTSATQNLSDTRAALDRLQDLPTARLERLFAEHVDLCSYRLDAWQLGLVNYQMARMRAARQEGSANGVYLGAYGWLEDVRPENKVLTPVELPKRLNDIFNKPGEPPLF